MNKKGFTLVEVLAVIVILLLLVTLIAPKVFKQLDNAENVTQNEQVKSLINIARIYVQKNNIDIDDDDYEIITIEELKNSQLINKNQVIDPKTKEEITGCIKVSNENNKYKYEYNEDICNNLITVTFDPQGGTLQETSKNVILNKTYGTLPTPTREGYTFLGWNGKNMFTGLVKGKGIRANDGVVGDNDHAATSDYIEVDIDSNNYYLTGMTSDLWSFVSFYNENQEYIGRTSGTSRKNLIINNAIIAQPASPPASGDVKYLRINQYENINATGTIDDIDNLQIQLEVGDTATEYEPYYITPTTKVVQDKNHTLKAIWQANE